MNKNGNINAMTTMQFLKQLYDLQEGLDALKRKIFQDEPKPTYTAEDNEAMGKMYDATVDDAKGVVAAWDLTRLDELQFALDFLNSEIGLKVKYRDLAKHFRGER
jgi:hypothetical protein